MSITIDDVRARVLENTKRENAVVENPVYKLLLFRRWLLFRSQMQSRFSFINFSRALRWHRDDIDEWSPAEWSVGVSGELGELQNCLKILKRLQCGLQNENRIGTAGECVDQCIGEIADVYIYLDILCSVLGINAADAIARKFNDTSRKYGFPEEVTPDDVRLLMQLHPGGVDVIDVPVPPKFNAQTRTLTTDDVVGRARFAVEHCKVRYRDGYGVRSNPFSMRFPFDELGACDSGAFACWVLGVDKFGGHPLRISRDGERLVYGAMGIYLDARDPVDGNFAMLDTPRVGALLLNHGFHGRVGVIVSARTDVFAAFQHRGVGWRDVLMDTPSLLSVVSCSRANETATGNAIAETDASQFWWTRESMHIVGCLNVVDES